MSKIELKNNDKIIKNLNTFVDEYIESNEAYRVDKLSKHINVLIDEFHETCDEKKFDENFFDDVFNNCKEVLKKHMEISEKFRIFDFLKCVGCEKYDYFFDLFYLGYHAIYNSACELIYLYNNEKINKHEFAQYGNELLTMLSLRKEVIKFPSDFKVRQVEFG